MGQNRQYLIVLLLVLCVFAVLVWLFQTKEVIIIGNILASEGRMRRVVGQPNLLWADLNQLEKDVAKDKFIKSVAIEVKWPSKLIVKVDEHKPIANIDISATLLQVALNGTILTVGEKNLLPTIRGLQTFPFFPGNKIPEEYLIYLELVDATSDLGLVEIRNTSSGTTLKMRDDSEVFLGKEIEKPQLIRQKIKEITMRGQHKYIDLSQKGYASGR